MGRNNKDFEEGKSHQVTWTSKKGQPYRLPNETSQKDAGKKIAELPSDWQPAKGSEVNWKAN